MQRAPDRESEGFFSGLTQKFDSIWQTMILPQRMTYIKESLGPEVRRLDRDTVYHRIDGQCRNVRGEKLEYSFFELQPEGLKATSKTDTCLVYLHSHGGSRLEGLSLLRQASTLNMSLCCFDFAGSGQSEGKYTTLGLRESEDCRVIVDVLMRTHGQRHFVLWGRSMGAVAAILYTAGKQPHIKSLVLDSPFSDVEQMVRDAGNSYMSLGEYLALFLFSMVKGDIKQHIGQDLSTFQPIKFCRLCQVPSVFMVGNKDPLVPPERVNEMYQAYGGSPKDFMVLEGSHSSGRSQDDIDKAFAKVAEHLKLQAKPLAPGSPDLYHPHITYNSFMSNTFQEIDSMISQKKSMQIAEPKVSERNRPKGDSQPVSNVLHNTPRPSKDSREKPAGTGHSRFVLASTTIKSPFRTASPRYVDFATPKRSIKPIGELLKGSINTDNTDPDLKDTGLQSAHKATLLTHPTSLTVNNENVKLSNLQDSARIKLITDLAKLHSKAGHSNNKPSTAFHSTNKLGLLRESSSSHNLLHSQATNEVSKESPGHLIRSPEVRTKSNTQRLTQISPLDASQVSQKYDMQQATSRLNRPAISTHTHQQPLLSQQSDGMASSMGRQKAIQDISMVSQHIQYGQFKEALHSRFNLHSVTTARPLQSSFSDPETAIQPNLLRTDSFYGEVHNSIPEEAPVNTLRALGLPNRFTKRITKPLRIFDDVEDDPYRHGSVSLLSHAASIPQRTDQDALSSTLRPPVASYL